MKKYLQRLKVWFYEKAMNTSYAQGTWYADNYQPVQAAEAFKDGDKYRAKWLEAQGMQNHPAFASKHNAYLNGQDRNALSTYTQYYEGDYRNYDN